MDPVGLLIVAVGLFSVCGAVFDWEWSMTNRKARALVALLGCGGAGVFYALLGAGIMFLGILILLGAIHGSQ